MLFELIKWIVIIVLVLLAIEKIMDTFSDTFPRLSDFFGKIFIWSLFFGLAALFLLIGISFFMAIFGLSPQSFNQ